MNTVLRESDKRLIAIYHCDHISFLANCGENDIKRVTYLNKILSEKQISECIKFYNLETFGVTHKECKSGKCILCHDFSNCIKNKPKEIKSKIIKREVKETNYYAGEHIHYISEENKLKLKSMGFQEIVGGIPYKKHFNDGSGILIESGGDCVLCKGNCDIENTIAFRYFSDNKDFLSNLQDESVFNALNKAYMVEEVTE